MPNKSKKFTRGSAKHKPQTKGNVRRVRLNAGESTTTQIGIFESAIPAPQLQVTSHPDIGDRLGVSITKIDEVGDYILLCRVQNLSTQPCDVAIWSAE